MEFINLVLWFLKKLHFKKVLNTFNGNTLKMQSLMRNVILKSETKVIIMINDKTSNEKLQNDIYEINFAVSI